eukprot:gene3858-7018_t
MEEMELKLFFLLEKDENMVNYVKTIQNNVTPKLKIKGLITKSACRAISYVIKHNTSIKTMALGYNHGIVNDLNIMIEGVQENKNIEKLFIIGNQISNTNSICKLIKNNNTIKELSLYTNLINGDGAFLISESLKINKSLFKLDLSENKLNENEIQRFSKNLNSFHSSLQKLYLENNKITDSGLSVLMDELKTNPNLKYLSLKSNRISYKGADLISKMLVKNHFLETFDLGNNSIGDKGATYIFDSLRFNNTLQELKIHKNEITNLGIKNLTKNNYLKILSLSENKISDGSIIGLFLKDNKTLLKLNLSYCDLKDDGLKPILESIANSHFIQIQQLLLDGNDISDDSMEAIKCCLRANTSLNLISLGGKF